MKKIILVFVLIPVFSCQSKTSFDNEIEKEVTVNQKDNNVQVTQEETLKNDSVENTATNNEIAGYVNEYNQTSKKGCLFIDKDMVEQGIVAYDLADVSENCHSDKFGFGLSVDFTKVQSNANYVTPKQGVLYSFKGHWNRRTKIPVFYIESFEPFF